MSLPENPGMAISSGAHAVLLAAALLSFSHAPKFDDAQESIPVEMVSDQEFNQIMKGEKSAAKQAKPLQRAEKLAEIAETKPQSALPEAKTEALPPPPKAKREPDPGRDEAKDAPTPPERSAIIPPSRPPEPPVRPAAAKPEPVKATAAEPPPSLPKPPPIEAAEAIEPKPVRRPKIEHKTEPKLEAKQEALTEMKPVEPAKKVEPKFKPDQLAKLLDQEKQKNLTEKPSQKPLAKPKSGDENAEPTQKFDPGDISKFLNKESPQKRASTGRELQQVASLGAPTANAAKMSPSLWGSSTACSRSSIDGVGTLSVSAASRNMSPRFMFNMRRTALSLASRRCSTRPPTPICAISQKALCGRCDVAIRCAFQRSTSPFTTNGKAGSFALIRRTCFEGFFLLRHAPESNAIQATCRA